MVDGKRRLTDKSIDEHVQKMIRVRRLVLSLIMDNSIDTEESLNQLKTIYNNTDMFGPDDWEPFVTSETCAILEKCEAIDHYLATDFHREPISQTVKMN